MKKQLIKGNEAVVKAAIIAGATEFFGYPITPASEIAEAASLYFPKAGRTFIQAESEVAAINMVFGAAAAGKRTMTASSGPGLSLKQEGISYIAGAEIPAVVVDVTRAGPGLGNVWPEQGDYNQIVKGGGHGNYKNVVLAPNSAQEMCDFTIKAFELADKYRCCVVVLTDGCVGQTMEPVIFPDEIQQSADKSSWALYANEKTSNNIVTSIYMSVEAQHAVNERLQVKYAEIEREEVLYDAVETDDADVIVVAYGITSRIIQSAITDLRQEGFKVGMLRPQTLFPFPKAKLMELTKKTKLFLVAELSNGQMVEDVKLATEFIRPVRFYGTYGGKIPTVDEMKEVIRAMAKEV